MMRLLVPCLLLLLRSTAVASEDGEASGDDEIDDEDLTLLTRTDFDHEKFNEGAIIDKTTGEDSSSDPHLTLIIVVVAVSLLALSIAAIVAVILLRRRMQSRQQGIYSVPTEQDHKEAI